MGSPGTRPTMHGACHLCRRASRPKPGRRAHLRVHWRTGRGPAGVIRHATARGTGVATPAGMNPTRTIESTLDVTTHTEVARKSTEAPVDALATKVFAATMAYVVIFITATVLLIAL